MVSGGALYIDPTLATPLISGMGARPAGLTGDERTLMRMLAVGLVPYPQDQVFGVLSDPERYAGWVVGATKTRTIDSQWPQPGSRFAHRQGAGPLYIDDVTVVRELDAPNRIVLEAKIRPLLTALVTLTLEPLSRGTLVTMEEVPIGGPVSRLGHLLDGPLHLRNDRALRRLEEQLAYAEAAAATSRRR